MTSHWIQLICTVVASCFAFAASADFFAAPSGVLLNYPEFDLKANGFTKCYDAAYSSATTKETLESCGSGSWLFVGAKTTSSTSSFLIGAYGFASSVFTQTTYVNQAFLHNGVYWYMKSGAAFGFSSTNSVWLADTDTLTDHNNRLSWRYDSVLGAKGGMRAGQYMDLADNTAFRKVVYKLATAANSPTVSPTEALPLCSVPNEQHLGDGYCDAAPYNTAACGYDRGDCCQLSCIPRDYICGFNGYSCIQPIDEIPTRNPTMSNPYPTVPPTAAPSAPTVNPTIAPSAPTFHPSAAPTNNPTTASPTLSPTLRGTSTAVFTFKLDSSFPYDRDEDVYKTISFPNATDDDKGVYYLTTITFSENTQLREGSDYIIMYNDNHRVSVYGDSPYSGTNFPGMNGAAALGFQASKFVFHFHSSAGEITDNYGYQMTVVITKQLKPTGSSGSSSSTSSSFLGLSRSEMVGLISFMVILTCISCCGLPFWYLQAGSSAKVAAVVQERRKERSIIVDDEEANISPKNLKGKSQMKGKAGKYTAVDEENTSVEVTKKVSTAPSPIIVNVGPPMQFTCSISCEIMEDPVICADGFTYDRSYIEPWLLGHDTSPMTNIELPNKALIPNLALKQIIADYKAKLDKTRQQQK